MSIGRLVNELYRSREELAASAVDTERGRVSRDLHDLLGQSLSAISLKGDLATRLLSVDPARARHEIVSLAELARSTLRDVRAVTRDEHQVTLREELAAGQGLRAAAGVDTRVDAGGDTEGEGTSGCGDELRGRLCEVGKEPRTVEAVAFDRPRRRRVHEAEVAGLRHDA